jgi:hypothetical protein
MSRVPDCSTGTTTVTSTSVLGSTGTCITWYLYKVYQDGPYIRFCGVPPICDIAVYPVIVAAVILFAICEAFHVIEGGTVLSL